MLEIPARTVYLDPEVRAIPKRRHGKDGFGDGPIVAFIPRDESREARYHHFAKPPYLCGQEGSTYGEVVSMGPEMAPLVHGAIPELIERAKAHSR